MCARTRLALKFLEAEGRSVRRIQRPERSGSRRPRWIARFDSFDPNTDSTSNSTTVGNTAIDKQTRIIAGISYTISPNLIVLLDIDSTSLQYGSTLNAFDVANKNLYFHTQISPSEPPPPALDQEMSTMKSQTTQRNRYGLAAPGGARICGAGSARRAGVDRRRQHVHQPARHEVVPCVRAEDRRTNQLSIDRFRRRDPAVAGPKSTVDFGASDGPLIDKHAQRPSAQGEVLHIPETLGAVVVTWNVPALGKTKLRLDGPTIANIYLGKITKWNDPAITKLNPGVKLPNNGHHPWSTDQMVRERATSGPTT